MFYVPNTSIDTFLIRGTHIFHYLDGQPQARALLARYGMDEARLQEGKALFAQLQATHWLAHNQRRQQKTSTTTFHDDWMQARRLYRRHRQAAREVLKSDASQLFHKVVKNYAGWLAHAQEFYSALLNNPSYLEQLATVDVMPDQLLRAHQQIERMIASKNMQTQSREGARTSKQARDRQLSEAKGWYKVLLATAEVAFRQEPGMLEALRTLPERLSKEEKAAKLAKAEAAKQKKAAKQAQQSAPVAAVSPVETEGQTA